MVAAPKPQRRILAREIGQRAAQPIPAGDVFHGRGLEQELQGPQFLRREQGLAVIQQGGVALARAFDHGVVEGAQMGGHEPSARQQAQAGQQADQKICPAEFHGCTRTLYAAPWTAGKGNLFKIEGAGATPSGELSDG